MAGLSPSQLSQAASYFRTSSASKNPISMVMELAQLLRITPQFDVFEPREISSVHQHVFACKVQFAGYQEKVTGYNKKKVKTDAAKQLIDRIKRDAEHAPLQRYAGRVKDPTPEQQHGHVWQTNPQASAPFNVASSGAQIGNAVGELQEYAMGNSLGMPVYSISEEVINGQWTFTATVRLPTIPDVQAGRASNKTDAKQLAAHRMLQAIKPATKPTQTTSASPSSPSTADKIETVEDRLSVRVLRKYLEQMGLNGDEVKDSSTATSESTARDLTDAFKNVDIAGLGGPANRGVSSIEKLNKIAKLECFKIEFHDIETASGSHMCLLKAELGSNMVCHGIGENQPQARENAAENMLFVIRFFKEKRQGKGANNTN